VSDGVTIAVKVVPGARHDRVVGRLGDAVKVQVSAAPERGRANAAVCAVVADFFGVRAAQVRVVSGRTQARKRVTVEGIDAAAARSRLDALPSG
jgi:hypothetical protein